MAEPDIEVEGPDGQVFAFPAGTGQDVMRGALTKHYAAQTRSPSTATDLPAAGLAGDESAAVGRGLISGVPVVGPALLSGLNKGIAGVRALQNDSRYSDELKKVEAFGEKTAAANPKSTIAGEIGGGVLGTAPLVAAAPAAFGAGPGAIGMRAAASALSGGTIGAGDAAVRGGGDLTATGVGGALGFGLGAAAPVVAAGAGRVAGAVASKIKPAAAVPTIEELKDGARAAYGRADDAGVQIAQPSFGAAVSDIGKAARDAGLDRTIHPKATAALSRLEEAAGTAPTLKDTELLRRILKGAAGSIEPDEKRLANLMVGKLDDFVGNVKPADLVSGDAEAATKALAEARDLWGRARKAQTVDEATLKAERRAASTGSGGNLDNTTRQNIRAILDNPKRSRGFTAEERDAMDKVVRGSTIQNSARLVGKLSPVGNGLMAALGIGATAANPLLAALPTAGYLAKMLAERGTAKNLSHLERLILSGGNIPVAPLVLPARQATEQVARPLSFGVLPAANQRLSKR